MSEIRGARRIRVGVGLGLGTMWTSRSEFARCVESVEATGWDSLWLSEHLTGATPSPLPALAFAAAITSRIRLGTSVTVVPGRSPVDLAKSLWTLAELCDGRLLPIFGLGTAESQEHAAFNVARRARGPWFDDALPVIRNLLKGETVTAQSRYFDVRDVCITDGRPAPISDLWMGGRSDAELRRVARHADGWLASFATPRQTRRSIELIAKQSAEVGRPFDDDHFGLLFPYARGRRPDAMTALLGHAYPDADPEELCPVGVDGLRRMLDRHTEAGVTKYILVPAERPDDWARALDEYRRDVEEATAQSFVVTLGR
ncbi:LLM class flavin-dependent oxidoreductase [Mycolicibacterium sp. jd]|uniref:LLM class flavin-dependent oxidoreductase n=1 Tax=unclassified Mycolicibacterium TaxID=2636767 RepID=UPI00351B2C28